MASRPDETDRERQCKDGVRYYLTSGLGGRPIRDASAVWRADDPPDYDLEVDGVSYALEATTLADSDAIDVHFKQRSIVAEIEKRSLQAGTLQADYMVGFPESVDLRKARNRIVQRACDWITTGPQESEKSVLYQEGEDTPPVAIDAPRVHIGRGNDASKRVTLSSMRGVRWQDSLPRDAVQLVNTWAAKKKDKLDKKGEQRPRVLALREDDLWAALVDYRDEFGRTGDSSGFAEIFVIGTMDVFTLCGKW